MLKKLVGCIGVLLFFSAPAMAQVQRTYWGVSGGFTPQWVVPDTLKPFFDADSLSFEGTDFRIGFVRGSILGGDWGVSFVRKTVSEQSSVSRLSDGCVPCGETFTSPDARMSGIEVHRFVSFGTIKERVQIGMTVAGGIASLKGTVQQRSVTSPTASTVQEVDAKNLFAPWGHQIDVVPLGKIELAATTILAPDFKLRFGGGFDFPGYNVINVSLVYLIGAR